MKRYKLKRNLPTFNAGDVFYLSEVGNLIRESDNVPAYSRTTLDKFQNILTDWFEEIDESNRWRPKKNHIYYCISGDCYVAEDTWYGGQCVDDDRFEIGNCFQTREEAERTVEYLKALAVVRGDATSKFTKGEDNWRVYYSASTDCLYPDYDHFSIDNGIFGLPYFATEEDAQRSIDQHKNEWLIIFGVKEKVCD